MEVYEIKHWISWILNSPSEYYNHSVTRPAVFRSYSFYGRMEKPICNLCCHLKFELNWMSPVMFPNGEKMIAWVTDYEKIQVVSVAFELIKLLVSLSLHTFKLEIHKAICFTYVWRISQTQMSWMLSTTWFMTSLSLVLACFLLLNSRKHQTT